MLHALHFPTARCQARLAALALACLAGWTMAAEPKGDDCLSCHTKPQYTQKTLHTAPAKLCSGCHVNHETKGEAKLLVSEVPDLCYGCHAEKGFKAKRQHDPVKQGACLDCHDAHSAEQPAMLTGALVEVCIECHGGVKEQPHVLNSFSGKGHPLGDEKELANTSTPPRAVAAQIKPPPSSECSRAPPSTTPCAGPKDRKGAAT